MSEDICKPLYSTLSLPTQTFSACVGQRSLREFNLQTRVTLHIAKIIMTSFRIKLKKPSAFDGNGCSFLQNSSFETKQVFYFQFAKIRDEVFLAVSVVY